MRTTHSGRLAWSLAAIGVACVLLDVLLRLITPQETLPEAVRTKTVDLLDNFAAIGLPLLGGVVASRRPENPLGWLFLIAGLGLSVANFGAIFVARGLVAEPGSLPGTLILGWLSNWTWTVPIGALPFLTLLFPTGRLPSNRWRPALWIASFIVVVLVGITMLFAALIWETPLAEEDDWPQLAKELSPVLIAAVFANSLMGLVGGVSLIFRFRAAAREERQQMKWFIFAASMLIGALALDTISQNAMIAWAILFAQLGMYGALAIAILKYRLYEIDRLITRTLTYAFLTTGLGALYFGTIVTLQAALRQVSGGSDLAIALTTLLVAALFLPARRAVQAVVDRRFNRRAYDAARIVDSFSARMREQIDLDTLREEVLAVVDETMQPNRASLWVRGGDR